MKNLKVETIVHNSALDQLIRAQNSISGWRKVFGGFQGSSGNYYPKFTYASPYGNSEMIREKNKLMKFYKDSKVKVK